MFRTEANASKIECLANTGGLSKKNMFRTVAHPKLNVLLYLKNDLIRFYLKFSLV
jgi:hypothetical protein